MIRVTDTSGNVLSTLTLSLPAAAQTIVNIVAITDAVYTLRMNAVPGFTFEGRETGGTTWTNLTTTGLALSAGSTQIDLRITAPAYSSDTFETVIKLSL